MQKTDIPWADYSINPVRGLCPMDCRDLEGKPYCYARKMYKRFKWNSEIQWDEQCLVDLRQIKEPSRIFVGSTMELFGEWVKHWWLKTVFDFTLLYPQHTFIFLTKCPQNLSLWSPYPSNVYIGVSVTNQKQYDKATRYLKDIQATVKFLSIEPLLERIDLTA